MNIGKLIATAPAAALAAALAAGCGDRSLTEVAAPEARTGAWDVAAGGGTGLTVINHNVYYGADFMPLLSAAPEDIPLAAAQAWATVQGSDIPGRAEAIAAEIAALRPHLVALQEAALYRVQRPGDAAFGGSEPATTVVYDFVELIRLALEARGLTYRVAAADSTTDVEVPAFTGIDAGTGIPTFDDVRLTDRDAILVRGDVGYANPQHDRFDAYVPLPFGGPDAGVYEGWNSVEATVDGRTYRFVAVHLEARWAEPVQLAQAQQLLALVEDETLPTIVAGDFNSDAYGLVPGAATATYGMMLDAGFEDAWVQAGREAPGLTCCQSADLSNPRSTLDQRIDFIFTRGMPALVPAGTRVVARQVLGDARGERIGSWLWPSDHAGVAATFVTPPPGSLRP